MPLRALQISLDTNELLPEDLPASVEQHYLGGRGAATWMLAHRLPATIGPLAPTNLLIFITAKTVNPDGASPSDVFSAPALESVGMDPASFSKKN